MVIRSNLLAQSVFKPYYSTSVDLCYKLKENGMLIFSTR